MFVDSAVRRCHYRATARERGALPVYAVFAVYCLMPALGLL
ncbi:hypothetical protein ACFC26_21590 [Kitasatospora purpeofusca]